MDLDALLRRAVELGATDMHLKEGKPPILRRDGALGPMELAEPLTIADLEEIVELVGKAAPARLQLFHNSGDLDVAYQLSTCLASASTASASAGRSRSRSA